MTPSEPTFQATAKATSAPNDQATASSPSTTRVVGMEIARVDYTEALDRIDAMVATKTKGYICVAPVHLVMLAEERPDLRSAIDKASFTVPDGMPLVWAMRCLGHGHQSRVYGPELMARACERAARSGTRMYLYGGRNEGALVQLTLNLRRRYPGLRIVGGWSPPFRPLTAEEESTVIADINRSEADIVWVGTGQPKQELWMAQMRPHLQAPVMVGVGAAFDFHAGIVAQAPHWMQVCGLEWTYRVYREPRRLWRRYLRYNPRFVAGFARQYAQHRRGR